MNIEELLAKAENYQFGENGIPKDDAKAAYYYERAAELGDPLAQYNIGLKYYSGRGVEEKMEKAAFWFRKAAEQGIETAQKRLDEMEAHDVAARVPISINQVEAYSLISVAGKDGAEDAIQLLDESLQMSKGIYLPTEKDLIVRRAIYRALGRAHYLFWSNNSNIETLKKSYEYYSNGQPVTEDIDERIVITYIFAVQDLAKHAPGTYGRKYCSALEQVYEEYADKFKDTDFLYMVLGHLAEEKCRGTYCSQDLEGVDRISRRILRLAEDIENGRVSSEIDTKELRNAYTNFQALINQLRGGSRKEAINDIKPKGPGKLSFYPPFCGVSSISDLVIKIIVYVIIYFVCDFALTFLAMIPIVGLFSAVILGIVKIYCVAESIVTAVRWLF